MSKTIYKIMVSTLLVTVTWVGLVTIHIFDMDKERNELTTIVEEQSQKIKALNTVQNDIADSIMIMHPEVTIEKNE
jgi:hypothetical protein